MAKEEKELFSCCNMIHVFSIRLDLSYFFLHNIDSVREKERDLISGRIRRIEIMNIPHFLLIYVCERENEI